MRLTVIALAMFPATAFAQEAVIPLPPEEAAQSQSCPAGMFWNTETAACTMPV